MSLLIVEEMSDPIVDANDDIYLSFNDELKSLSLITRNGINKQINDDDDEKEFATMMIIMSQINMYNFVLIIRKT